MARQRTPEGPPPAPPVQKLRLRYARRGRLRFSSTRDFARALERALRRAEIPMAYSAGFHPHPKISYAGGAPTGTASEAEYFEISLRERRDPEQVRRELDAALPVGLDILEVVEAGPGSMAERLEISRWEIDLPGVSVAALAEVVAAFLETDSIDVTRVVKSGPRTFDVRAAVTHMEAVSSAEMPVAHGVAGATHAATRPAADGEVGSSCAILAVVVRHTTPVVRPDDILTALQTATDFVPPRPPRATRVAQGRVASDSAQVADPLATDKDAAGS